MIVPATVAAVTSTETVNARGKFVSDHASWKPLVLKGAGREKTLPSTACSVVLKAVAASRTAARAR